MAAISGDWDVEALKRRLHPRQVDKWAAWDSRYPLGDEALRDLIAKLVITVAADKGARLSFEDIAPWTKPLEDEE